MGNQSQQVPRLHAQVISNASGVTETDTRMFSSFGLRHSFAIQRQSGSNHSCFVIHRRDAHNSLTPQNQRDKGIPSRSMLMMMKTTAQGVFDKNKIKGA